MQVASLTRYFKLNGLKTDQVPDILRYRFNRRKLHLDRLIWTNFSEEKLFDGQKLSTLCQNANPLFPLANDTDTMRISSSFEFLLVSFLRG